MSDILIKDAFPIERPDFASVRIFFAKAQESDRIWHLCDAALGYSQGFGRPPLFMALHGKKIYVAKRADSLTDASIALVPTDFLCARCLDEFFLAFDIIKERKLLKFK
jgi:hypothetical protein